MYSCKYLNWHEFPTLVWIASVRPKLCLEAQKCCLCVFMRWGLLGFKLHICHQDRFLLLYYSTSVTLRATCNNKGDNSLLTKPWIKVPKRSRTEYNRGKPASIIEAGAFNAAFICNLHPWEQRRQDYKRYNTQSSIQNERRGADIQTFSICCPQKQIFD